MLWKFVHSPHHTRNNFEQNFLLSSSTYHHFTQFFISHVSTNSLVSDKLLLLFSESPCCLINIRPKFLDTKDVCHFYYLFLPIKLVNDSVNLRRSTDEPFFLRICHARINSSESLDFQKGDGVLKANLFFERRLIDLA